ncbi:PASTA domain-containing protein [Planobispora takensis]|uniref:PASTA domain-containing protein n=1 Tax=Planobispora takensis TaxID=1367882 RepID=A0A8J3SW39_9ACTN|nr:PASTA domain-containing protein [Planobispora takensis]GII00192.1 hypothetical protein Pta02_22000 [Planobispora takensis]
MPRPLPPGPSAASDSAGHLPKAGPVAVIAWLAAAGGAVAALILLLSGGSSDSGLTSPGPPSVFTLPPDDTAPSTGTPAPATPGVTVSDKPEWVPGTTAPPSGVNGQIQVPDVRGVDGQTARTRLQSLGFSGVVLTSILGGEVTDPSRWRVVDQTPGPGMTAGSGQQITLRMIQVPDF